MALDIWGTLGEEIKQLQTFVEVCGMGLGTAAHLSKTQDAVDRFDNIVGDFKKRNEEEEKRLRENRARLESFATREVSSGAPYLHGLATIHL